MFSLPQKFTFSLILLMIVACGKNSEITSPPNTLPEPPRMNANTPSGSTTGVPNAEAVFSAPTVPPSAPPAGRPNSVMTPGQEATGMPIPGQNNDHSAPLPSEKPASKP